MMGSALDNIFNSYAGGSIFKNKSVLQINYTPETIPHRTSQIESVASILAPALKGERVSNLFIYGKTGSGKTLSVQYVTKEILKRVTDAGGDNLRVIYINCKLKKVADTEYRILAEIISSLGESVPATGLPTDAVYSKFIEIIERKKQLILILESEVRLVKKKLFFHLIMHCSYKIFYVNAPRGLLLRVF